MCMGVEFWDTFTKDRLDFFKIVPGEIECITLKGDGEFKILWPTEDHIRLTFIDDGIQVTNVYRVYNFVATFKMSEFDIDEFLLTKHYESMSKKIPTRKYEGYFFFLDEVITGGT